ncbi:MAG: hypothetical protein HONBIEJF_01728 [Fimbriimonadaceae bacterium]|nr:hypothetical protein [Fimbriimonadaceae bacterium]
MVVAIIGVLLSGLPQADPADIELNRFRDWWRRQDRIAVSLKINAPGLFGIGTGSYELKKPIQQRFDVTFDGRRFQFVQDAGGVLEIEHAIRRYIWYPDPLHEVTGPARPEGIEVELQPMCLPYPLQFGNLRGILPQNAKYAVADGDPKFGVPNHLVTGTADDGFARRKLEAWIARNGELLRFRSLIESDRGRIDIDTRILPAKNPGGVFDQTVPTGYVLSRLPFQPLSLAVGQKFPTSGSWTNDGRSISLTAELRGRTTLILLAGANECSARLAAWLESLKLEGIDRRQIAVEPGTKGISGAGPGMERLKRCGSPTLCLVDGSETIRALWLGFDGSEPEELAADIREAIASLRER